MLRVIGLDEQAAKKKIESVSAPVKPRSPRHSKYRHGYMNYSLNSLKGGYIGDYYREGF